MRARSIASRGLSALLAVLVAGVIGLLSPPAQTVHGGDHAMLWSAAPAASLPGSGDDECGCTPLMHTCGCARTPCLAVALDPAAPPRRCALASIEWVERLSAGRDAIARVERPKIG